MSGQKSIISISIADAFKFVAAHYEDVTKSHVIALSWDEKTLWINILHHEGPSCPNCGRAIHEYGHGLCLSCWNEKKAKGMK